MLQTFWFLLKTIILVAVLVAVINLSGEISIDVFDYSILMPTNVFFLSLVLALASLFLIYKLVYGFVSIPKRLSKQREETRHQKGFNALTKGLVAIAAGDSKQATYYSKRAKNLLPMNQNNRGGQQALHLLLEAQAARLRGEEGLAQNRFEALMQDKEAGFLGIRGLLKAAMDKGNERLALEYVQQAAKLHPNQIWVIQTLYHLQIQNKMWDEVLKTAKQARKYKALEEEKIASDEIAIYLMRYDHFMAHDDETQALDNLKKAHKLNNDFTPTIIRYAEYFIKQGKKKKAANFIKKAWETNPHPDLARIWNQLVPSAERSQEKHMQWYQNLCDANKESVESYIMMANAAMDLGLWGEAKSFVLSAEEMKPSARIYRLRAIVEQNTSHSEESIQEIMEKAAAALPDKVWICLQTGMIYEEWTAVAAPHGSFNTVVWQYPGAGIQSASYGAIGSNQAELLIDPV